MIAPARAAAIGTGLVIGLVGAGLAWRECLLLVGGAVAGVRLFLIYMDSAAPWEGWRAAISCISAGAVIALSGAGLTLWTFGVWMDWWAIGRGGPTTSLALLAGAALSCCWMRSNDRWLEVGFWLPLLALAGAAAYVQRHGMTAAPCILLLVGAAALIRTGWHLASQTSTGLLQAGARR
jgi:hypothetical protein